MGIRKWELSELQLVWRKWMLSQPHLLEKLCYSCCFYYLKVKGLFSWNSFLQQELCRAKQPPDKAWLGAGGAALQVNLAGNELFLSCCPGSGAQTRREAVESSSPDAVSGPLPLGGAEMDWGLQWGPETDVDWCTNVSCGSSLFQALLSLLGFQFCAPGPMLGWMNGFVCVFKLVWYLK